MVLQYDRLFSRIHHTHRIRLPSCFQCLKRVIRRLADQKETGLDLTSGLTLNLSYLAYTRYEIIREYNCYIKLSGLAPKRSNAFPNNHLSLLPSANSTSLK